MLLSLVSLSVIHLHSKYVRTDGSITRACLVHQTSNGVTTQYWRKPLLPQYCIDTEGNSEWRAIWRWGQGASPLPKALIFIPSSSESLLCFHIKALTPSSTTSQGWVRYCPMPSVSPSVRGGLYTRSVLGSFSKLCIPEIRTGLYSSVILPWGFWCPAGV